MFLRQALAEAAAGGHALHLDAQVRKRREEARIEQLLERDRARRS